MALLISIAKVASTRDMANPCPKGKSIREESACHRLKKAASFLLAPPISLRFLQLAGTCTKRSFL